MLLLGLVYKQARNLEQGEKGTALARYEALMPYRRSVLNRAREAAALTVPHLMPPEGHSETAMLPTPYQSIGARGLRNLASKLLLTLFPPHQPFFKYSIDDFAIDVIEQEAGEVGRGEIEKALAKRERSVMKEVEASFFRTAAFEAFRQLLVAGNVLIYVPEDEFAQVYRVDRYVVKRDPQGIVLEIILKLSFSPNSLPPNAQKLLKGYDSNEIVGDDATADIYTYIRRTKKGKYEVHEELEGRMIPGSKYVVDEDRCPWRALRFTKVDAEDYGRGYMEEYLGDLISADGLSQTVLEGAAIIAKIVTMVSPNGSTKASDVSSAENGAVISGRAEDVTMLQAEKRGDLSVAQQQITALESRLAFAFLMNTSIQRSGERVTAEEIRYMAQELEDALGGVYSLMAMEFQLPMAKLFEHRMERNKKVPPLPKDLTSPTIVTGIEALGRGQDLRNLDGFLIGLGETFGPDVIGRYIKLSEAIKRRGVALGVDMAGLVRTEDEVKQAEEQARLQELAQNLGPQAIQAMGNIQGKTMDNNSKEAIAAAQNKKGDS